MYFLAILACATFNHADNVRLTPQNVMTQPYRVLIAYTFDSTVTIPENIRTAVKQEVGRLIERHQAKTWAWQMIDTPANLSHSSLPSLAELGFNTAKFDKLLWLRIDRPSKAESAASANQCRLTAREYDTQFGSWSMPEGSVVSVDASLPLTAYRLLHGRFRARLIADPQDKDNHSNVRVQGFDLQPASSEYPIVREGQPFEVRLRQARASGETTLSPSLRLTYLVYHHPAKPGLLSVADVVSSISRGRPLIQRKDATPREFLGLAISVGERRRTTVQLVEAAMFGGAKQYRPVEGLGVEGKPHGDPALYDLGVSDRNGRITIASPLAKDGASNAAQLLQVSFKSVGRPTIGIPIVPGSGDELRFNVGPSVPGNVQGRIVNLQDELTDIMIRRKAKMKGLEKLKEKAEEIIKAMDAAQQHRSLSEMQRHRRELEQQLAAVDQLGQKFAREFNALPGSADVQTKIDSLREDAKQAAKSKSTPTGIERSLKKLEFLLIPETFGPKDVSWVLDRGK